MSPCGAQPWKRAALIGVLTGLSVTMTILGAEDSPSGTQILSALVAGLSSGATAFLGATPAELKKYRSTKTNVSAWLVHAKWLFDRLCEFCSQQGERAQQSIR